MSNYVIEIHSNHAYLFKIVADLLHENFNFASFIFHKKGITISEYNERTKVYMRFTFLSEKFDRFYIDDSIFDEGREFFVFGFDAHAFQKSLQTVRKKNKISIVAKPDTYLSTLDIIMESENKTDSNPLSMVVHWPHHGISIDKANDFNPIRNITYTDFKELSKKVFKYSKDLKVLLQDKGIKFVYGSEIDREVYTIIGEFDDSKPYTITNTLSDNYKSINKLSSLCKNITVYKFGETNHRFNVRTDIGSIDIVIEDGDFS